MTVLKKYQLVSNVLKSLGHKVKGDGHMGGLVYSKWTCTTFANNLSHRDMCGMGLLHCFLYYNTGMLWAKGLLQILTLIQQVDVSMNGEQTNRNQWQI